MRWLSSVAALQLLCLLDVATAIQDYDMMGVSKKLSGRHEALLLFKRQASSCGDGFFQCPIEFGGGCCANGRTCATRDCPAAAPGRPPPPPPANTNPPPTRPATSAAPPPTSAPASTNAPATSQAPSSSDAPETTSGAPDSSTAAPTDTSAPSSSPPPTGTATESSTVTNAADAAGTTTSSAAADGTLYTPMGISSGAIVGIVFAAITGAVIVGLVLWRAIIGIRHPKRKGKRPMAPGGGVIGAAGAGTRGFFSGGRRIFGGFGGGKKSGTGPSEAMMSRSIGEDQMAPMSQTPAAMGFGPQSGDGGVPPYMQDRSSLEEQDTAYSRGGAFQGGDLGYQSVESFDRQDSTQGLFPRAPGGGFPDR
ncbi:hypothetical protein Dda_5163 [Drechslerella dactyloides]|uniref:Uncharacterized protein n=1 Tax=Drechslerella dactyloides TaxID=74499 RepID=A0AAD6NHA1_DREDA|nr:hypothetical protein Dda_5163 [Drechslerella dactyloides]